MKKVLSLLLSAVMLTSVLGGISFNAYATTNGYTRTSAASYIENTICGHGWNIDGGGAGYDCVDLVYKYFRDLGNYYTIQLGNAYIFANNATLPSGWTRQYRSNGYTPQKGDIACWGTEFSSTGHVALVYAVDSNNIYVVEQASSKNVPAYKKTYSISSPKCFIVPDFPYEIQYGAPIGFGTRTVSDGDYHIVSALNPSMGLDAHDGNENSPNNTNIQLYNNIDYANQVFTIKYHSEGYYTIQHKASKKFLDVYNGELAYGANVVLYDGLNNENQMWIIQPSSDRRYYNIISKCNGLCLDVFNAEAYNEANVEVYGNNNNANQQWSFVACGTTDRTMPDGKYEIVPVSDNTKCLDVYGAEKENGTQVTLYTRLHRNNQVFEVKYLGKGYYEIADSNSGKVLDLPNSSAELGKNITIFSQNNGDNQKWIIKKGTDNTYNIISKSNGQYLDVYNSQFENGTQVIGYYGNGDNNQKWRFICQTHKWNSGTIIKKATYTATGVKTCTCTVCGETKSETVPKLAKKANPIVAKGKTVTVKYAKVKKKAQTVAQKNAFAVSKAQGKVTYSKASGNKKITVSKAGKITVKKGLKKGTYKVKVKVTAAGNTTYKAATKTVTVTIKVK